MLPPTLADFQISNNSLMSEEFGSENPRKRRKMDEDEALARKLQAEFDGEAHDEGDDEIGWSMQDEWDGNADKYAKKNKKKQKETHSPAHDSAIASDASGPTNDSRGGHPRQVEDHFQIPQQPVVDLTGTRTHEVQEIVRGLAGRAGKLCCSFCTVFVLGTERDIVSLARSLLDRGIISGGSVGCHLCGNETPSGDAGMLMIWALLCLFDNTSKHNKIDKPTIKDKAKGLKSLFSRKKSNGIGYGGDRKAPGGYLSGWGTAHQGTGYGAESDYEEEDYEKEYGPGRSLNPSKNLMNGKQPQQALDEDDQNTVRVMNCLVRLQCTLEEGGAFKFEQSIELLQALFSCSSILERAAELLRNNDLENVTVRVPLYTSLLKFVQALASSPVTSALVFNERVARSHGARILDVSLARADLVHSQGVSASQPLAYCMRELALQAEMMVKSYGANEDVELFRSIKELNDFITANSRPASSSKAPVNRNEWHNELAVADLPEEVIISRHSLMDKFSAESTAPSRMKRIMRDIAGLQASLPDGIFVRFCSSRPDIMKILIVGPEGTPYENGLFEFDLLCGPQFPKTPPAMKFRTTGGGRVSFNPNLYPEGKICLSLLGTWSGEPWNPSQSTLLQVLVSIQAMIFCENPWLNEPGRESMPDQERQSQRYNQSLHQHTVRTAMLDWLERRQFNAPVKRPGRTLAETPAQAADTSEGIWDEIINKHFASNGEQIIQMVEQWRNAKPPPQSTRPRRDDFPMPDDISDGDSDDLDDDSSSALAPPSMFKGSGHTLGAPVDAPQSSTSNSAPPSASLLPLQTYTTGAHDGYTTSSSPFGRGYTLGGPPSGPPPGVHPLAARGGGRGAAPRGVHMDSSAFGHLPNVQSAVPGHTLSSWPGVPPPVAPPSSFTDPNQPGATPQFGNPYLPPLPSPSDVFPSGLGRGNDGRGRGWGWGWGWGRGRGRGQGRGRGLLPSFTGSTFSFGQPSGLTYGPTIASGSFGAGRTLGGDADTSQSNAPAGPPPFPSGPTYVPVPMLFNGPTPPPPPPGLPEYIILDPPTPGHQGDGADPANFPPGPSRTRRRAESPPEEPPAVMEGHERLASKLREALVELRKHQGRYSMFDIHVEESTL